MPTFTTLTQRAIDRYRTDGAVSTARASARHVLRSLLRRLEQGKVKGGRYREADLSAYGRPSDALGTMYDVILVTDLRFIGGSGMSSAQELEIQSAGGLRTGLYHLPTRLVNHRSSVAPSIDKALREGKVDLLNDVSGPVRTRVLIFRHPTVLNPGGAPLPEIKTDQTILIVNHTPIKFDRIEYLLPHAARRLREAYGHTPHVHPIGPLIRQEINKVYDETVRLADDDWVNVFDVTRFATDRTPPKGRPIRIGRHSRPNPEKWPADPADIKAAYPNQPAIEVHVLGGADIPERLLGKLPSNWIVHEFGAKEVPDFLRDIDVFVYFHHPDWIEAFGRVIVEAMAAGLPVILPPHFEPLLGDAALYCEPEGVVDILDQLRDPTFYMLQSKASRDTAVRRFSTQVHLDRLRALGAPQASA